MRPRSFAFDMCIEDKNSVDANLTMTRFGNCHGHDPSSHELLGIARVGPLGELFGGHESRSAVTDAVDMAASSFGIQCFDYHIPAVLSQEEGVGRAVGIAGNRP